MAHVGQGLASLVEHTQVGVLRAVCVTHRVQLVLVTAGGPAHTLELLAWKLGSVRQTHSLPWHTSVGPTEETHKHTHTHTEKKNTFSCLCLSRQHNKLNYIS